MILKKFRKDESGATAVIVALMLVVLIGMVAIVVDLGSGYSTKVDIQSACDLAALAGANELANGDANAAENAAYNFAEKNGFNRNDVHVEILGSNDRVRVSIRQTKKTIAAGVIGVNNMNISGHSVAGICNEGEQGDFDYAVFSGSTKQPLAIQGSDHIIEGKIHSNNTFGKLKKDAIQDVKIGSTWGEGDVEQTGGIYAYQVSASKPTSFSWNVKKLKSYEVIQHSQWWSETKIESEDFPGGTSWGSLDITASPKVDMPYDLGDAINAMISKPVIPSDSYWNNTFKVEGSKTINDQEFKNMLANGGNTRLINAVENRDGWIGSSLNTSGDLLIEPKNHTWGKILLLDSNGKDASKQGWIYTVQAGQVSTINGDIYIKNKDATCSYTRLYLPTGSVINGNIYCPEGNLIIGDGVTVNGNIYVGGNLVTEGSGMKFHAPKYIYANNIYVTNTTEFTGAVVAEKNMVMNGGGFKNDGPNNVTSFYSRSGNIFFSNCTDIHGYIYAPYGQIKTAANQTVYGKIIADTLNLTSQIKVFPYDKDKKPDYMNAGGGGTPKKVVRLLE